MAIDVALEAQILAECRLGRATAYRPLVDAYFARAVRSAHAMVGNGEDARDLAQEAFVAAYKAMPTHEEGRPFFPWLRGILLNRCRMFLRSRGRAAARARAAAERPGHWVALSDSVPSAGRKTTDLVRRALVDLDEDDRSLIVLKHVEGYTYDELAVALGIPRGTVMSRLYRVRKRMRARLEELDPSLRPSEISEPPEVGGGVEANGGREHTA